MFNKKIVISGATGFLGRHLVKACTDKGFEVYALVRNLEKASSLKYLNSAKHVPYDLSCGSFSFPPDCIFIHCAWGDVRDTLSLVHIERHFLENYLFLKNIINYGVKRIIVTGSCYEYGLAYGPVPSSAITNPNTPYSIAKDMLHKALRSLQAQTNFELIWTRLFYMYGDGQDEECVIAAFDRALKNGDEYFNISPGEQLLDYLPVEEVAEKIVNLISRGDGTYNICSGKPISLRRFLELRALIKKGAIKLNVGFYSYRSQDSMAIWGAP